jgi:hypothetical protein
VPHKEARIGAGVGAHSVCDVPCQEHQHHREVAGERDVSHGARVAGRGEAWRGGG